MMKRIGIGLVGLFFLAAPICAQNGGFAVPGGSGTVTSISAGCAASTGGSAITTSGTIAAVELVDAAGTGNNYAMPGTDCGYLVNLSNGSAQTPTIAQAGTGAFTTGWFADVCNIGAGTQTLTPATSTIGGNASQAIKTGQCVRVVSDGANYQLAGLGPGINNLQTTQVTEQAVSLSGCNGSTATMDLTKGTYFYCTVSAGTTTFAVSNNASSGQVSSFTLELTNGGSQTIDWMTGTKWPGGSAPTLTSSGVDLLVCSTRDGATTWRCVGSEINSH